MHILVYDIANDRARSRVAETCQDYNLTRIQMSTFAGAIPAGYERDLMIAIERALDGADADVRLFTLCERDAKRTRLIQRGEATYGR